MATGDDAQAAGFDLVSSTDLVRDGDDEINKTRDYVARMSRRGTVDPPNTVGQNGDVYFKIL